MGFSGADLENLVNQAALKAAMDEKDMVTMKDLEFAKDKIIMGEHAPPLEPITLMRERRQVAGFKSIFFVFVTSGPERRSVEIDKKNKTITAYHESGHAIVAYYTKDAMPINKATIMPRGPTLGHVSARYFSHSLPVTFVVSFLNILFLKTTDVKSVPSSVL